MPILRQSIAYEVGCRPRRLVFGITFAPEEDIGIPPIAGQIDELGQVRECVLIVEDAPAIRALLRARLQKKLNRAGVGLLMAKTAKEAEIAIKHLRGRKIEALKILDFALDAGSAKHAGPVNGGEILRRWIQRGLIQYDGMTAFATSRTAAELNEEMRSKKREHRKGQAGIKLRRRLVNPNSPDSKNPGGIPVFNKSVTSQEDSRYATEGMGGLLSYVLEWAEQRSSTRAAIETTINLPAGDTPQTNAAAANTEPAPVDANTLQEAAA